MDSKYVALLPALALCLPAGPARAQDRVSVYGAYFREASTRVIEPMVSVSKMVPHGIDVTANYLLDAITSASVAQGVTQDNVFHETRQEAGLGAGYTFDRARSPTRVGGAFRFSRESDYESGTVALQLSREVWGRSGFAQLTFASSHDRIKTRMIDKTLDTLFMSANYTQALSPTWLLQGGYEIYWLDGYQSNPYVDTPNLGRPSAPDKRLRHVLALRAAKYFPAASAGVQAHYRFYFDHGIGDNGPSSILWGSLDPYPWGMIGHTAEARVYKAVARDFEVRLSYRFHHQSRADFWCNTSRGIGGNPDCYGPRARYHSADQKFGPVTTSIPELKLSWNLRIFAEVPFLRILAPGTADIAYARFIQDTHYGDAHLLQAGYSLPF